MLVDSHCHLDFPDFAGEHDAVLARARAAGVGTMLTICTRLDQFPAVRAIAEAYDNVWCSVGAHPHEAAEHAANHGHPIDRACRTSPRHRHRRDRSRFLLRSQPARYSGAGIPRAYRGLPGQRTAADRARTRCRCRDRDASCGRNARMPVFCIASAAAGVWPRRRSISAFTYRFRVSSRFAKPTICARSSVTCRSTGCWSRPTHRISRRFRIAASATSRPMSPLRRRQWRR